MTMTTTKMNTDIKAATKYPDGVGRIIKDAHGEDGRAVNSILSVMNYPAPNRAYYFNPEDYAAACARCYTARMKFDGKLKKSTGQGIKKIITEEED